MAIQTNIEMGAGDEKVFEFTVRDSSEAIVNLSTYSVQWVLRTTQTTSVAILTKTTDTDGGITVADPDTGVFSVELEPDDTKTLAGAYYYEAHILDADEHPSLVAFGFLAIRGVTSPAYCTLDEAMALMADVMITENTTPNLATAQIIVETIARDIDGVLMGRALKLPITDAGALDFLKTINQYGACAAIIKSKKPINSGMGGDDGAFGYYETKYKAGLAQLARRSFNLIAEEKTSIFAWGSSDDDDAPFWTRGTSF